MERGTLQRGWTLAHLWQAPASVLRGWRNVIWVSGSSGSPWGAAEVRTGKAGFVEAGNTADDLLALEKTMPS